MANRPGDGIRVITPSRKILNRGFHMCLCYDTGGRAEGRPALGNRAKSSKSGSPGPVLTKADAVTDRARRVHRRQTDACSGRPRCCPSSLSQRRRKRSGQKAQDAWKANRRLQRSPLVLPVQLIPEAQEEIRAESSGLDEDSVISLCSESLRTCV